MNRWRTSGLSARKMSISVASTAASPLTETESGEWNAAPAEVRWKSLNSSSCSFLFLAFKNMMFTSSPCVMCVRSEVLGVPADGLAERTRAKTGIQSSKKQSIARVVFELRFGNRVGKCNGDRIFLVSYELVFFSSIHLDHCFFLSVTEPGDTTFAKSPVRDVFLGVLCGGPQMGTQDQYVGEVALFSQNHRV